MAGRAGANEVIREGLANDFLENYAIHKEIQLLEEVWTRISSNGAVAYGEQSLVRAMAEGAIETLLVAVDLLRDEQTELDGKLLQDWVRGLDDIGESWSNAQSTMMQVSNFSDSVAWLHYFGTKWCSA